MLSCGTREGILPLLSLSLSSILLSVRPVLQLLHVILFLLLRVVVGLVLLVLFLLFLSSVTILSSSTSIP